MGESDVLTVWIPDIILRDAYLYIARKAKCFREKFCSRTELVEMVLQECGPEYAHVRIDWIRERIPHCCKNPGNHGGGWRALDKHGPPKKPKLSSELKAHYASEEYRRLSDEKIREAGGLCQVCCRPATECHHRCYDNIGTPLEKGDLIAICRKCHTPCDSRRRRESASLPSRHLEQKRPAIDCGGVHSLDMHQ